jgi:hypothetical protein
MDDQTVITVNLARGLRPHSSWPRPRVGFSKGVYESCLRMKSMACSTSKRSLKVKRFVRSSGARHFLE